jgi:hypothetical protein
MSMAWVAETTGSATSLSDGSGSRRSARLAKRVEITATSLRQPGRPCAPAPHAWIVSVQDEATPQADGSTPRGAAHPRLITVLLAGRPPRGRAGARSLSRQRYPASRRWRTVSSAAAALPGAVSVRSIESALDGMSTRFASTSCPPDRCLYRAGSA